MKAVFFVIILTVLLVVVGLWLWRLSDHRSDRVARMWLMAMQPANPARFDPSMVSGQAVAGIWSLLKGMYRLSIKS